MKSIKPIQIIKATGKNSRSLFYQNFLNLHEENISILSANLIEKNQKFFYVINANQQPVNTILNKYFLTEIPVSIKNAFANKMAFLVIDTSGEGQSFNPKIIQALHDIASELKTSPSQIIWLNQNLALPEQYQVWAEKNQINNQNRVKILFYHSLLISLSNSLKEIASTQENIYNYFNSLLELNTRQKYFLCLNNVPREHRVFMLLNLYKEELLKQGLISFSSLKHPKKASFSAKRYEQIFPNQIDLLSKIPEVETLLPMTLDTVDYLSGKMIVQIDVESYKNTYFSLVTESEMSSGNVIRFTEKIFKPIINLHPFIVAGNPRTLSLLKEMGFKTFNGWIDESYDQIENPEIRAIKIIEEVKRLCSMTEQEIHDWYLSMLPILLHNAEHFFTFIPSWIKGRMGSEILYQFRSFVNK